MANHSLCSQRRNDHPGSNFCRGVGEKFLLWFSDVIQLPVSSAVYFLNISCKHVMTAQIAVEALYQDHK